MNPEEIRQIGPYTVRRFIAQGGMAWVFEVTDPRFGGHEVVRALKLLKPSSAAGEDFERFKNEAGLLARIDEPNLVTIFDFGKDEETDCFYYTMTFVDGPSMSEYLAENGAFEVDPALDLFISLLGGLAELHRRNIVHRDIKPANVLLSRDGLRPRLADLGIAREEGAVSHTQTGFAVGTVHYMAPEQARGQTVSAASDVFSMGLTLFEALTGDLLYDTIEDVDTTNAHEVLGYLVALGRTGEELRVDFSARRSIPLYLARILETACRYNPEERYANASEMRQALLDFRAGLTPTVRPRPRFSRRLTAAAAAAAAAVILLAGAFFLFDLGELGANPAKDQLVQSLETRSTELQRLDTEIPRLVARTLELSPPPSENLLAVVDEEASAASRELSGAMRILGTAPNGRLDQLGEGVLQLADESMRNASDDFSQACQLLTDEYLAKRRSAEGQDLMTRVEVLRKSDAPELTKDSWASIEKQLQTLTPHVEEAHTCSKTEHELNQIQTMSEISTQLAAIEDQFSELQPELADEARALARKTQRLAQADSVKAPEYQKSMQQGREALQRGEAAQSRRDYTESRRAFSLAAIHFEEAETIPDAWREREKVRELEREVEGRPGIDLGSVSMLVAKADDQWETGSHLEAGQTYARAFERLKRLLTTDDLRTVVGNAQEAAELVREAAKKAGALQSAPTPFALGEKQLEAGQERIRADAIEEAAVHFNEAEEAFSKARDDAIEAMADARELARRIRSEIEACADYSLAAARQDCDQANPPLVQGEQALEQLDAPAAQQALAPAIAILERAEALQLASLPPEIVTQAPERAAGRSVEVWRNARRSFSIDARARKPGDLLRYVWSFDGKPLEETQPRLEWIPPKSGRLQVTVSDGRGGESEVGWDIDVINHAPRVALQPKASGSGPLVVRVGDEQVFQAQGEDPDRDPVSFSWTLDGQPVGSGNTYTFSGTKTGSYDVAVLARDDAGAETRISQTIDVRPPSTPQTEPTPSPARGGRWNVEIQATGLPTGVRAGMKSAFGRYSRAFAQKNMNQLKSVWTDLDAKTERTLKKGPFEADSQPSSTHVLLKEATDQGDGVFEVIFERSDTSNAGAKSSSATYRAQLRRSGNTGNWTITQVEPYLKARRPRVRF